MPPMTTLAHPAGLRPRLLRSLAELGRFCLVGASGYLVNVVVFTGLTNLGAGHLLAASGAFSVAVSHNYHWNRRWTFRAPGCGRRFLVVSFAAFLLALGVLDALVAARLQPVIAQAVSVVAVTPFSYLANRMWAFGQRRVGRPVT